MLFSCSNFGSFPTVSVRTATHYDKGYDGLGHQQLRDFVATLFRVVDQAVIGIAEPLIIADILATLEALQQQHAEVQGTLKGQVATLSTDYVPLPGKNAYFPAVSVALVDMATTADSLQRLKQQHADLQAPLEILWAARLALIGALVALGWTLRSLIVTALADSPIAVPAAAVETDAAAVAAETIAEAMPALTGGLDAIIATLVGDTLTLKLTTLALAEVISTVDGAGTLLPTASQLTSKALAAIGVVLAYEWVDKTCNGQAITVRKLTNKEVNGLRTASGQMFEREKQGTHYGARGIIYIDEFGDYYIGGPNGDELEPFP